MTSNVLQYSMSNGQRRKTPVTRTSLGQNLPRQLKLWFLQLEADTMPLAVLDI